MCPSQPKKKLLVLDTNIVLDLFVFNDPTTTALHNAVVSHRWQWIASVPMRDELERVLTYSQIVKRLAYHQTDAAAVLAKFDAHAELIAMAPKATVTCKDPDDQKFIDLAVAYQAYLFSKDHAVLCMKKRLAALGVRAQTAINFD